MPESNEIRPIGNALNNDVREGSGARGGVGLGGACKAEANADVDGREDEGEPECIEEVEGIPSNGIGSRFLVPDAVRGSVRDRESGVAGYTVLDDDDGGKKESCETGTRRIVRGAGVVSVGV